VYVITGGLLISEIHWLLTELLARRSWTEQRSWKMKTLVPSVDCLKLRRLVTS